MTLANATFAPNMDVAWLDRLLLDENGHILLLPASAYRDIDPMALRVWCHNNARYCLPTKELVAWLKEQIGGRKAIEIGSGNGDLAYHLGIQGTDSYCQTRIPWVAKYYQLTHQPVTRPTPDIAEFDAVDAVKHFQPEVVVASWVTQYAPEGGDGSSVGIHEDQILDLVDTYIHVGCEHIHGRKNILARPHERKVGLPWIVSRRGIGADNAIYIWSKNNA